MKITPRIVETAGMCALRLVLAIGAVIAACLGYEGSVCLMVAFLIWNLATWEPET